MANPVSFISMTINDSTVKSNGEPESASWSAAVTTLTAANYVAQKALIDALFTAVEGVIVGNSAKTEITIDREMLSQLPAATNLAQREIKLLLRYEGATSHKKFRISIPTFDLSLLPIHSEFLPLDADEGLALKTAFEAIVKSPDNGTEATVLLSAQFVGRNT